MSSSVELCPQTVPPVSGGILTESYKHKKCVIIADKPLKPAASRLSAKSEMEGQAWTET